MHKHSRSIDAVLARLTEGPLVAADAAPLAPLSSDDLQRALGGNGGLVTYTNGRPGDYAPQ